MAGDEIRQCAAQGQPVKGATEAQGQSRVIGVAAGRTLLHEPERPLPVSERVTCRRGGLERDGHAAGRIIRRWFRQRGGKSGNRVVCIQRSQRERLPKRLLNLAHQANGEQRVTAQVKKVIVDADPRNTQHLGVERRQLYLGGGARRGVVLAQGDRGNIRSRQRLAINFAARRQRPSAHHDKRRRQHIVGQRLM